MRRTGPATDARGIRGATLSAYRSHQDAHGQRVIDDTIRHTGKTMQADKVAISSHCSRNGRHSRRRARLRPATRAVQAGLVPVLDLGAMPTSDGLVSKPVAKDAQARYPLELGFCGECSLVQLSSTLPPEAMFGEEYLYYSSYSDELLRHSRENAQELIERHGLGQDSHVVEVASNDGYMFRNFAEAEIPVLGIDPAPKQAAGAKAAGESGRSMISSERIWRNASLRRANGRI